MAFVTDYYSLEIPECCKLELIYEAVFWSVVVKISEDTQHQNPWGKVMERSGLRFENFCS